MTAPLPSPEARHAHEGQHRRGVCPADAEVHRRLVRETAEVVLHEATRRFERRGPGCSVVGRASRFVGNSAGLEHPRARDLRQFLGAERRRALDQHWQDRHAPGQRPARLLDNPVFGVIEAAQAGAMGWESDAARSRANHPFRSRAACVLPSPPGAMHPQIRQVWRRAVDSSPRHRAHLCRVARLPQEIVRAPAPARGSSRPHG
jgi:hypothetical protein